MIRSSSLPISYSPGGEQLRPSRSLEWISRRSPVSREEPSFSAPLHDHRPRNASNVLECYVGEAGGDPATLSARLLLDSPVELADARRSESVWHRCQKIHIERPALQPAHRQQARQCEPQHFYLTVHRFYGKVQGMTGEIDRCIDWCMSKGKLVFTAQRFGNWCANKVKWDREQEINKQEMEKLKTGTVAQRSDYQRRM